MAHVLIPTDLSENARKAAIYAVELYGVEGNTFTLLNCYAMPHGARSTMVDFSERLGEDALEDLTEFERELREALPGRSPIMGLATEHGNLTEVLKRYEQLPTRPDLIVMGTQGATGLKRILVGSNAASVILRVRTPVLAVPEQAVYKVPERIILLDDGRTLDKPNLQQLLNILEHSGAELMVVHIARSGKPIPPLEDSSAIKELFGSLPRTHHSIKENNLIVDLNELADKHYADIIAVPHRHRSQFERYFHRSMSGRLAMNTRIPMLVLQLGDN